MALPPTIQNLFIHQYHASHYFVIIMKATNQRRLPPLDLCLFGLDMKGGILVLAIYHAPAGPDVLIGAIVCGCVTQGKACNTQCHHIYMHDGVCLCIQ